MNHTHRKPSAPLPRRRLFRTARIAGTVLALLFIATGAQAGTLDTVKGWLSAETLAVGLSAALAIMGGLFGTAMGRVRRTFVELGEFLSLLGSAVEDSRITRDELSALIREGRDVLAVWQDGR